MRARSWVGMLGAMVLVAGCSKSDPTPAPAPAAPQVAQEAPIQPEPLPVLEAQQDSEPDADDMPAPPAGKEAAESPEKEAELMAQLAKDPKNADLLLAAAKLVQVKAFMTESEEPDYELFKKSGDFLHRALEADPKLAESEEVKRIAPATFIYEACALSREKQDEAGLKALKAAIDFGWSNVGQLKEDPDLDHLRQNPGFAPLLEIAVEKRRQEISAVVDELFQERHDFTFDFDLKDSDAKPLAKKEFDGKVLMVNVWATWCGPCRQELPDLVAAHKKYQSQGFEIVGLNAEREEGEEANAIIKEAQKEFGITYRCARIDDKITGQIPDFQGYPTTLFIDRQGVIRARLVGAADGMLLELIIERLLKDSAPAAKAEGDK